MASSQRLEGYVWSGRRVPDVLGSEHDLPEMQRATALLHVRQVAFSHSEHVDLEGVDGLEGFLPPPGMDGHRVLCLGLELPAVDVDDRSVDQEVGDDVATHELSPLDARAEPWDPRHGRIRIEILDYDEIEEIDRAADDVETEPPYTPRAVLLHRPPMSRPPRRSAATGPQAASRGISRGSPRTRIASRRARRSA
jgi:hypothetical protein